MYEFNLQMQHRLCPDMDHVPFGKRGSYSTAEFLRGKYYWTAVKATRYFLQRRKYPPTYVYDERFRTFLLNQLQALYSEKNHILHHHYDVDAAIEAIQHITGNASEGALHRFSNIVLLYHQLQD